MKTNGFVFSVIAIVVAVVVLGSCLIPSVQEAIGGEAQTITYENNTGVANVYRLQSGDSILAEMDQQQYTITAGGNEYTTATDVKILDQANGLFLPSLDDEKLTVMTEDGITTIENNNNIINIFFNGSTTWLLTSDGKAYGCGRNNYGQQGSGDTTNVTSFTDRTPSGVTVSQIVGNARSTWLLTSDGKAYGCGQNTNGQQGSGDTTDVTSFAEHEIEINITTTIGNYTISLIGTDLTITVGTLTEQDVIYLISDVASLEQKLLISEASEDYYTIPANIVSFSYDASSFYIGTGATVGTHYGEAPTLATVNGTATDLSSGYGVYLYENGTTPITVNGTDGFYAIIDLSYSGEVGSGINPMWATLLTLSVTLVIVGVVLGTTRLIGGRE